ncbi:MAG: anthranilate phosphoribosyltransferase, partial [Polaribacter sp.]
MKAILNKLYNHERLSKSEAKQVLIDIAAGNY